ncbi:MAG: NAD-dependent protein deacetylase [Anaerostipes sp.]|nr:NAD-dependent protein deacetylase [Anaerostipes sp.]
MKYEKKIEELITRINEADAIIIGAGSGMSAAAGFRFYYERDEMFVEHFGEFEKKYHYHNAFDAGYYRYRTSEERWALYSRMICTILDAETGEPYRDLDKILKDKCFHILTTNQDTQFTHIYPDEKISAIQGDWRYLQCSRRCHDQIYPSSEIMHKMNENINEELAIPTELIPRCPKCGAEMEPWIRSYVFLEGKKYQEEHEKWQQFVVDHQNDNILFLELGVGRMTPMFIQEPFWNLTHQLPNAYYITINPKDAILPKELSKKGLAIHDDIAKVLKEVTERMAE